MERRTPYGVGSGSSVGRPALSAARLSLLSSSKLIDRSDNSGLPSSARSLELRSYLSPTSSHAVSQLSVKKLNRTLGAFTLYETNPGDLARRHPTALILSSNVPSCSYFLYGLSRANGAEGHSRRWKCRTGSACTGPVSCRAATHQSGNTWTGCCADRLYRGPKKSPRIIDPAEAFLGLIYAVIFVSCTTGPENSFTPMHADGKVGNREMMRWKLTQRKIAAQMTI